MVSDPEDAEAEASHERLRSVHLAELLRRNGGAVRKARRQAGHRRLVPGRESDGPRELADLGLPEARVDEGSLDTPLPRGEHPRPVISQIVHRRTVDEVAKPLGSGDRTEAGEELLLAEEAAVRRVGGVGGVVQLARLDHEVPQADPLREPPCLVEFSLRVAFRDRGSEDRPGSERLPRRPPEEGRVHTPRERDHNALEVAERFEEVLLLRPGLGENALGSSGMALLSRNHVSRGGCVLPTIRHC